MKTRFIIFSIFWIFIIFLLFWLYRVKQQNYNKFFSLKETIKQQKQKIEKLRKKQEILERIQKFKNIKNEIIINHFKEKIKRLENANNTNLEDKQIKKQEIEKEKILDVKFYSQFPLDIVTWKKYDEPYQNFCEEASLLNWYYYLVWKEPDLKQYNKDLLKLKEIEDLLFEWWYKHTSLEENLQVLIAFQEEKQKIYWEILKNPTIEDIKENISKWNLVITPLYWKWLTNPYFKNWWPVYHNILIKGYTDKNFIVNEVWISKWDWFRYKQEEIMKNIHNFNPDLYPDKFLEWKKEILILYK